MNEASRELMSVVFFGLLFAAIGVLMAVAHSQKKKRCIDPVMAVVIENKRRSKRGSNGHRTVSYAPVFQYYYNGMTMTETSSTSSNPPKFRVGEEAELLINPNKPSEFIAVKDNTAAFISVLFALIGIVITIAGIFMMLKARG